MSKAAELAKSIATGGVTQTGTIMSWSNSTVPDGFLECDGSAVSRTTYSALFAVISTDYGSGDGSSTFNLPDLQDNVAVGASGTKAVASTGGNASQTPAGTITVNNHTITEAQMPAHAHAVYPHAGYVGGSSNGAGGPDNFTTVHASTTNTKGSSSAHNHGGSFSGSSMSVLQPYVAMKFMIKT